LLEHKEHQRVEFLNWKQLCSNIQISQDHC